MKRKAQQEKRRPRRLRREYGIGDFLDWMYSGGGLRNAVKRIQREEQLLLQFDAKGKPVVN